MARKMEAVGRVNGLEKLVEVPLVARMVSDEAENVAKYVTSAHSASP